MSVQSKHDSNGNIDKLKGRYEAKGFKQIEGIEFLNNFAPTSKPENFKILLALSAIKNIFLKQIDVKSAFKFKTNGCEIIKQRSTNERVH